MVDTSPIIFVEPVARGFRLSVLASAISAVRENSRRPIFVVTREDFASRELANRIESSWNDVKFVASSLNLRGADTGILGEHAAEALLDSTARMLSGSGPADLVFLGADDYLSALATQLPTCSARVRRARTFVFLYNSEDLVAGNLTGAGTARLGREAIASIEAMGATLLAFDERLSNESIGARRVKVLPDPWYGEFAIAQRKLSREAHGLGSNALLVTADIDLLLDAEDLSWSTAVARLAELPFVHFALRGNVWALHEPPLQQLVAHIGKRLVYAGPAQDADVDIKLIAATDLLLSRSGMVRCADRNGPDSGTMQPNAARRLRVAALGAAFDRDVRRLLLDSVDSLRGIPGKLGMSLMRDELDRLAHERLLRAFGVQLRAALRRGH